MLMALRTIPEVGRGGHRAHHMEMTGLQTPFLLDGVLARLGRTVHDDDATLASIIERHNLVIVPGQSVGLERKIPELAIELHLHLKPGIGSFALAPLVHHHAVLTLHCRVIGKANVLHRRARVPAPGVHIHVQHCTAATMLAVEVHLRTIRLLQVQVQIIKVAPREADADDAIHLAASHAHAVLHGVGHFTTVAPREVVVPWKQRWAVRVTWTDKADEIRQVRVVQQHPDGLSCGQHTGHELGNGDGFHLGQGLRIDGYGLLDHVEDIRRLPVLAGTVYEQCIRHREITIIQQTPVQCADEAEFFQTRLSSVHHARGHQRRWPLIVSRSHDALERTNGSVEVLTRAQVNEQRTDGGVTNPGDGGASQCRLLPAPVGSAGSRDGHIPLLERPEISQHGEKLVAPVERPLSDQLNGRVHGLIREFIHGAHQHVLVGGGLRAARTDSGFTDHQLLGQVEIEVRPDHVPHAVGVLLGAETGERVQKRAGNGQVADVGAHGGDGGGVFRVIGLKVPERNGLAPSIDADDAAKLAKEGLAAIAGIGLPVLLRNGGQVDGPDYIAIRIGAEHGSGLHAVKLLMDEFADIVEHGVGRWVIE